jgi:hypothetical protein
VAVAAALVVDKVQQLVVQVAVAVAKVHPGHRVLLDKVIVEVMAMTTVVTHLVEAEVLPAAQV